MAISSIPSDIFRKAEETDIERIWQIIGQAKAQMQRLGSQQWDENYPAIEHIRQDIQDGNGYVICREMVERSALCHRPPSGHCRRDETAGHGKTVYVASRRSKPKERCLQFPRRYEI